MTDSWDLFEYFSAARLASSQAAPQLESTKFEETSIFVRSTGSK
jgi:hypothetical protein